MSGAWLTRRNVLGPACRTRGFRLLRGNANEKSHCWPWSNPDSSGQLLDDVKLDGFSMPWNAMPDAGKLAPGIPKSNFWASDPNGINQVGAYIRPRDLSLITWA